MQRMNAILSNLARILAKHDHVGQAEVIRKLLQYLEGGNQGSFVALIHSVDMWGDSGAVWEVCNLGDDTREFQCAIIELAAEMDDDGLGNERSRFIASTFAKWSRMGV
jgi:hypothetical protein